MPDSHLAIDVAAGAQMIRGHGPVARWRALLPRTQKEIPMSRPQLKKRLGQHHLRQGSLCRPLIDFLEPAGSKVVEIGLGGGVLTAELLKAQATVVAWEVDYEWAFSIRQDPALEDTAVVVGDALAIPWQLLPPGTLVAGNLPYQVSTALIGRLLPHWQVVPRACFLVQWEVADRLRATPADGAYGALSILTAARAEVALLSRVPRGAFHPPPKVDGAFVGLTLREPPLPEAEMGAFTDTVRLAFAQRRKMLRNSLAARWGRPAASQAIETVGLDSKSRAEGVSLEEFLALHEALRSSTGDLVSGGG
jgi:16S rRNA (adenine1518-N6/adenine1519-N6)-dimethyltransferase